MSRYDDILSLPHHVSPTRTPMARENRAAQFAPFAALEGYEACVTEAARLTDRYAEPDEDALALLSDQLHALLAMGREQPEITLTVFEPDAKKTGGAYLSVTGRIRRIDEVSREVILADRTVLSMDLICGIQGVMLPGRED